MTPVRLEPAASRSRVKHSTTEPLRSPFKFKKKPLLANSGEPDQMPCFVASDLVLHCLPMSNKKDARLIWVNMVKQVINKHVNIYP